MNIFAKVEKRIKDALIEYFTVFIMETVEKTVEGILFQEPKTVALTITETGIALDGNTLFYNVYNIDATKNRAAAIYVGSEDARIDVRAKDNSSGIVYVHYGQESGKLSFNGSKHLLSEGFNFSYDPGKIDMLFWTKRRGYFYWRRAKSF